MLSPYVRVFERERSERLKNGLYEHTLVHMAYNTNRLEGSTLTLSDTETLYERGLILTGGHRADDVIETRNHFGVFNFMLDTIAEPLTEPLIKAFHLRLKHGTLEAERYGAGLYKTMPNLVGDQPVAPPHQVVERMAELLSDYHSRHRTGLEEVLTFHHRFELIHPFQDGNGRVGRMIMFRQCLTDGVEPFIILADRREQYLQGLRQYTADRSLLIDEAQRQQAAFRKVALPFLECQAGLDAER